MQIICACSHSETRDCLYGWNKINLISIWIHILSVVILCGNGQLKHLFFFDWLLLSIYAVKMLRSIYEMAVNLFIVDFLHWFEEFGREFNDFSKKPALTPLFEIQPIALNMRRLKLSPGNSLCSSTFTKQNKYRFGQTKLPLLFFPLNELSRQIVKLWLHTCFCRRPQFQTHYYL